MTWTQDGTNLTSVEIPDSVTTVGSAFADCTALTRVSLGKNVSSTGAFEGCRALTAIYYGGCEKDWEMIRFFSGNFRLQEARIHYETELPTSAPSASGDLNNDGSLSADDAIYLLYHTLFGDGIYPLN